MLHAPPEISVGWFRERIADADRRSRWVKRGGVSAVLLALSGSWWWGRDLEPLEKMALVGGWLLALAAFLLCFGVRIFGPVCFYDLIRTGRQARYAVLRSGYAAVLLLTLSVVYVGWFAEQGGDLGALLHGGSLDSRQLADFAASFFSSFAWVQLLAALLLTPVYVGSALTEEKERGTLDNLLASDLHDQEIVLGKLVSRLAHLLLVLLAGLPVLALTQLLGGVEPALILVTILATATTVVSLGSLSMLCSVYARRTANAVFSVYFWISAFLVATFFIFWFSAMWNHRIFPVLFRYFDLPPLQIPMFTWGNPWLAGFVMIRSIYLGTPVDEALADALTEYLFFHSVFTIYFCYRAVRKLRVVALTPDVPKPLWRRSGVEFPPRLQRVRLGNWPPLLWKEVHADAPIGSHRFSALMMYFYLVLGWLLVALFIGGLLMQGGGITNLDDFDLPSLQSDVNGMLRSFGPFLAGVMLFAIGFSAAGSVSRERERQTLDGLLTLPVDAADILFAKWLGTPLTLRPLGWCLGIMWAGGVLIGGLHILAVPLLILAWIVYASFLSGLGLAFSIRCRTSMQATVRMLLTLIGLLVACRLVANYSELFLAPWLPTGLVREVERLLDHGLVPWSALSVLSFPYDGFLKKGGPAGAENLRAMGIGLLLYLLASTMMWFWIRRQFRQATGQWAMAPPEATAAMGTRA